MTPTNHGDDSIREPSQEADARGEPAWEMIEDGRYRPRRVRGSYHGRELG